MIPRLLGKKEISNVVELMTCLSFIPFLKPTLTRITFNDHSLKLNFCQSMCPSLCKNSSEENTRYVFINFILFKIPYLLLCTTFLKNKFNYGSSTPLQHLAMFTFLLYLQHPVLSSIYTGLLGILLTVFMCLSCLQYVSCVSKSPSPLISSCVINISTVSF